jgi:hypothetical protein
MNFDLAFPVTPGLLPIWVFEILPLHPLFKSKIIVFLLKTYSEAYLVSRPVVSSIPTLRKESPGKRVITVAIFLGLFAYSAFC